MISFPRKKPSRLPIQQPVPFYYKPAEMIQVAHSVPNGHIWARRDETKLWGCIFPCNTIPCCVDVEWKKPPPELPPSKVGVKYDNYVDFKSEYIGGTGVGGYNVTDGNAT